MIDSLYDFRMMGNAGGFVGLQNYQRLFADSKFIAALINNLIYIVGTVIPGIILALALALMLKNQYQSQSLAESGVFLSDHRSPGCRRITLVVYLFTRSRTV